MKGGVSLAVWIGGAVAELDLLRSLRIFRKASDGSIAVVLKLGRRPTARGGLERRAKTYGALLAARGYHRVEIDILAGASAGGLNSVLFATAQRAGRSVSSVVEVWKMPARWPSSSVPRGGAQRLPSSRAMVTSIPRFLAALQKFHTKEGRPHPGLTIERVSVDLSATAINAKDSVNDAIREGRAGFRFESESPGNDIPAKDAAEWWESLQRLALAARSTSSFPEHSNPRPSGRYLLRRSSLPRPRPFRAQT